MPREFTRASHRVPAKISIAYYWDRTLTEPLARKNSTNWKSQASSLLPVATSVGEPFRLPPAVERFSVDYSPQDRSSIREYSPDEYNSNLKSRDAINVNSASPCFSANI